MTCGRDEVDSMEAQRGIGLLVGKADPRKSSREDQRRCAERTGRQLGEAFGGASQPRNPTGDELVIIHAETTVLS